MPDLEVVAKIEDLVNNTEPTIAAEIMTNWQNAIIEYHNRLLEFLRLYDRDASPELLREHAQGVNKWRVQYREKGLKGGRSPTRHAWLQKHFPDIPDLESRYRNAVGFDL